MQPRLFLALSLLLVSHNLLGQSDSASNITPIINILLQDSIVKPEPEPCPELSVPGVYFDCSNPITENTIEINYQIDDRGTCPTLISNSGFQVNANRLYVRKRRFDWWTLVSGSLIGTHHINGCVNGEELSVEEVPAVKSGRILTLSGARWTASYTVTGDENGVTVSDIIFAPQ